MPQLNDLSRSLVALDQDSTIIAVVEMSQSSWLVGGVLPGIERQPRKKLEPSAEGLLGLLHRWRDEAVRAGWVAGSGNETTAPMGKPLLDGPCRRNSGGPPAESSPSQARAKARLPWLRTAPDVLGYFGE